MIRAPPRSTRTDTLFPYTTLFRSYAFALREARRSGNALAVSELEAIAPYPGPEGSLSLQQLLVQRKWVIYFGGLTAGRTNFDYEQQARLLSPEYTAADHAAGSSVGATLVQLLPGLTRLDYRDVPRLDLPLFLVAGRQLGRAARRVRIC